MIKKFIPGKRLKQQHRNAMSVDGVAYVSLKAFALQSADTEDGGGIDTAQRWHANKKGAR